MLQQLYIRNYALVREVRMDFANGFSVLTGETGAGKSILLGALGLVLGERADTSVLRDPSDKCVVEGIFVEPRLSKHPLVIELDMEQEAEWCIRREVTANGKSRAFLNDTPVTLSQLQSFVAELVDLHQQFDSLEITESDRQRSLLDVMAGITADVQTYHQLYNQWRKELEQLRSLEDKQARLNQEQEYNQFMLQELQEAAFQPGELELLEEKVRSGGQSEGMTQALAAATEKLQGEGENLLQQMRRIQQSLSPFEKNNDSIQQWLERLRSVDLELRELAREMDRFGSQQSFDPAALAAMQERLSQGFRLLKKHGLKTTDELIDFQNRLSDSISSYQDLDASIRSSREQADQFEKSLRDLAGGLHRARASVIGPWSEQVNKLLFKVGMPSARFGVELKETELRPYGTDDCLFVLDANFSAGKGEINWQPIRKVASGGELSRLMLCIKSLVADRMQLPTLIFDEIDAGISGEAAKQVGYLLRGLGSNRQVICVTHQPQVAGKGQHHWHVSKSETDQGIETKVELLDAEQRVEALARLLGGASPTETARRNAAELLGD